MTDSGGITIALDQLAKIQADLAAVSTRTDERRRHDLIELRRQLAAQIMEIARVTEPWIVARNQPELLATYRDKFSRMRSAAAIHQANWPAVRLDQADENYRQSVQTVRERNRDFVKWLREVIRAG